MPKTIEVPGGVELRDESGNLVEKGVSAEHLKVKLAENAAAAAGQSDKAKELAAAGQKMIEAASKPKKSKE